MTPPRIREPAVPATIGPARVAAAVVVAALLVLVPGGPAHAAPYGTAAPVLPREGSECLPPPQATDPSVPWAQRQLAPQEVWNLTRGAGVTVAVVDSGVDESTPQLAGRVATGVDVTTDGPADTDCYGHGTFVAGILAAAPAPDTGFAGVAPDVRILPIRATAAGADGSAADITASALAAGVRYAVDAGAQVINVSASTAAPDAGLAAAVDYAAAADVVVVASAANGAQRGVSTSYPASYPSVIAVGAVDSTGAHADFSQTGPYLALVAPGVDVISVGPRGPGHWQGSGTSYAAPFVAGTAALVRAYRPDLTAAQVKQRLIATADHPAADLPDPALGFGMVNPMAAVTAVLPEEGPAGEPVAPSAVSAAVVVAPDTVGPVLVIVAVVGALGAMCAAVMVSRLGGAGRRRGWRRARVVEVVPTGPGRSTG